jgi:hypothetical protein
VTLAQTFDRIVGSLPSDWTDLELDLRISDLSRYVEAAVLLSACNAQPYSHSEWHWRLACAHSFGHAAAPETVEAVLRDLDEAGIAGEIAFREVREGRVEAVPMWGRPESVRREFSRRRAQ